MHQLKSDPDCMGRIEAIHELKKIHESEAVQAIVQSLKSDGFWGVQAEAADALAEIRSPAARTALIEAISVLHPKARLAVVKALGQFKDERATQTLKALADADASYFVEAEAVQAWASSQISPTSRSSEPHFDLIESLLLSKLEKPSFHEVIRSAALHAMADLPGIGRGERPMALQALIEWTRRGKPEDARIAAVDALGKVGRGASPAERAQVLDVLSHLAEEVNFRLRMVLIHALEQTESPDAIRALHRMRDTDPDPRVKRSSLLAADRLAIGGTPPESVIRLKSSLEKLEEDHRKLRSLVEELKGPGGSKGGA